MTDKFRDIKILIAEDDDDDFFILEEILSDLGLHEENIVRVHDGKELLDYLQSKAKFENETTITPSVIFLDLNMPVLSGKEALRKMQNHKDLAQTLVVVHTTSSLQDDINYCYENGAKSYLVKEAGYEGYTQKMRTVLEYWSEVSELPNK